MKTNLFKNTYAAIAALFIAMLALPQQAQAQEEKYQLWIAGVQVTSDNYNDLSVISGVSGTVKYDHATKTLTLDNATINTTANNIHGIYVTSPITIKVKGTVNIKAADANSLFILATSEISTITGTGTLNLEGWNGLEGQRIVIENITINAKGEYGGIIASSSYANSTFEIRNANITAEGNRKGSIVNMSSLTLDGCKITQPAGAAFNASLKGVALNGQLVKTKIVIEPIATYNLAIAGTVVTSDNCDDLSVIDGVSGTVSYNPSTKTLTLDNATIINSEEGNIGMGIYNCIDGLTIRLVGQSTLTSEKRGGIYNEEGRTLTFTGSGKFTVNGSTTASNENYRYGIRNRGYITVSGCTLEVSAGVDGIGSGRWKFDHCTVRAKGGGTSTDEYAGSIGCIWYNKPELIGCDLAAPAGAYWKDAQYDGYTYYSVFGADDKVVTDWVTISPDPSGIDTPTTVPAAAKKGIYTLSGVRLQGELKDLPKGIYIVNGRKVVKQ